MPARNPSTDTITAAIQAELTTMGAANLADLVEGAPPRRLRASDDIAPLPYSDGQNFLVQTVIEPGPPSQFRVPTGLLSSRFGVTLRGGQATVTKRPERASLAAEAALAIAGEAKVVAAASNALTRTGEHAPGASWSAALRRIDVDARLPASEFSGEPTWLLIFEPWDEKRGWNGVQVDAKNFGVTMVNGRAP